MGGEDQGHPPSGQGQKRSPAGFQGGVRGSFENLPFRTAESWSEGGDHDFDVMFAETIETHRLGRRINFSIRADLGIAMLGGPGGDVGMKSFSIADDRSEDT